MTDKEQITNNFVKDINVPHKEQIASKCECYTPETKFCSETLSGSCMGEKCQTFNLIKQLARKTQECEELKEKNSLLESQMTFNLGEMEIRLGDEINRSETLLKELKRFDKTKDEFREMSEKLKTENTRYRKALKDIEGYLKLPTNVCLTDCSEYSIGQSCSQNCFHNRLKLLLDIINKAKGGEDE